MDSLIKKNSNKIIYAIFIVNNNNIEHMYGILLVPNKMCIASWLWRTILEATHDTMHDNTTLYSIRHTTMQIDALDIYPDISKYRRDTRQCNMLLFSCRVSRRIVVRRVALSRRIVALSCIVSYALSSVVRRAEIAALEHSL